MIISTIKKHPLGRTAIKLIPPVNFHINWAYIMERSRVIFSVSKSKIKGFEVIQPKDDMLTST